MDVEIQRRRDEDFWYGKPMVVRDREVNGRFVVYRCVCAKIISPQVVFVYRLRFGGIRGA